jgi:hypothetical protein
MRARKTRRVEIAVLSLYLVIPFVTRADEKEIGFVAEIKGDWCRGAIRLKRGDSLKLDDDVRYCSRPIVQSHSIVIAFRTKVDYYSRAYECSTPGICDRRAKLWLQGGYQFAGGLDGMLDGGYSLISRPHYAYPQSLPSDEEKRRRKQAEDALASIPVFPDSVIVSGNDGARMPPNILAALANEDVAVSPISRITFTRRDAKGSYSVWRFRPGMPLPPIVSFPPGLYGVYKIGITANIEWPSALWLVTPPGSDLPARWNSISEAFRDDPGQDSVEERRWYLLELFKSMR